MGDLNELRITRYREEGAFQRVVDFLAEVFPERSRDELAAGLAVTPVLLSHAAAPAAAEALRDALTGLGATVRITEADLDGSAGSVEIGTEFLVENRRRRANQSRKVRPMRAPPQDSPKAPWDED